MKLRNQGDIWNGPWYKGPQVDVSKLIVQSNMLSNLELALKEIPEAGLKTCSCAAAALHTLIRTSWDFIQNQATRESPSTAFEGRKVTAETRRCPPISHSQAPSPVNPRPPTDTNDYRKYESIPVGRIYPTNCPCCQQNLPPKASENARLHSLKSGEGETRSSPVVKAPSRPPSPLRNEVHSS